MKKKILSTLLCMTMMATMVTGYGVSEVLADDGQELTIMHMWSDDMAEQKVAEAVAVRKAIDSFKEKHPDVKVVEEQISQNAGYESKIKTLAAANELPDVFLALPSMMSMFYDNGQIMDLAPILDEEKEWNESFSNGAFGDYTFGENILGIPRCAIMNHVLYWNEEIFSECGINEFPKNSTDMLEAVKILKSKGYIPMACGNKGKYLLASQIMPGILFKSVDNEWYESVKNYDGGSFENPEVVEAITYLKDLIDAGFFNEDVNSIDELQARELYYAGKAAMYVEGSWSVSGFINDTTQEIRDKTNITVMPPMEGKENLDDQIVTGQGWGFALNADLEENEQDLAIDFLKELTSPEIQAEGVENGLLSVLKDTPYDEKKLDPFYKEFLELYNSKDVRVGCPEVQLSVAYMDASYTGYQELSVGDMTPENLAKSLQEAHESAEW